MSIISKAAPDPELGRELWLGGARISRVRTDESYFDEFLPGAHQFAEFQAQSHLIYAIAAALQPAA